MVGLVVTGLALVLEGGRACRTVATRVRLEAGGLVAQRLVVTGLALGLAGRCGRVDEVARGRYDAVYLPRVRLERARVAGELLAVHGVPARVGLYASHS